MASKFYGDTIWTRHALRRLAERGLSQKMAWSAFQYPESSVRLDSQGTMQYRKSFGNSTVTVVAKRNSKKEWIILSCWINPPVPGTIDSRRRDWYSRYRRSGFWSKLFMYLSRAVTGRDYY